jgi:hypothetical protein
MPGAGRRPLEAPRHPGANVLVRVVPPRGGASAEELVITALGTVPSIRPQL